MGQINMDEIKDFIYRKIKEEGRLDNEIDGNTELVESRIISSLLLVQIITGIEDIIDLPVINDNVALEDFSTINRILSTVSKACGDKA